MNLQPPIVATSTQTAADTAYQQGIAAWRQGDAATAARFLSQAIQLSSGKAEYYNLLGLCYGQLGKPEDSAAAFRQALDTQPSFTDAGINLSTMLCNLGHRAEAERIARETAERDPSHVAALCNLGVVFARQRKPAEAKEIFLRVLQMQPNNLAARRNLAHVYRETGQFAEALAAYQAVLRLNPRDGLTHEKLSQMQHYTSADLSKCSALKTMLKDPTLPQHDRVCLHFTLGKMYEDIGDYDASFKHYRRGNEGMPGTFDRRRYEQYVDKLIEYFTPELFARRHGQGSPSVKPVFIVGMPRSGTTLTEQILSRHPDVFGAGERQDIPLLMRQLFDGPTGDARSIGLDSLPAADLRRIAEDYLECGVSRGGTAQLYMDKMPSNFLCLGLIALLFPQARVIHCRRDPRDTAISCYASHFASLVEFAQNLGDIGFYYRQYDRLMKHWQAVLPLPMLDIQYEQIVADQVVATRKLLDFCDLSWDDRCLNFHESTRPVSTVSDWQVRQPLYSTSVGRWRKFAVYLGPLQDELKLLEPKARTQ